MRRAISLAALLLTLSISAAQAGDISSPQPLIPDAAGAIAIAYAFLYSNHPDQRSDMESEAVWESHMQATLENGVWHVRKKPNPDPYALSGSYHFLISQSDGRLVDYYYVHG
jgi:hypothetical protein